MKSLTYLAVMEPSNDGYGIFFPDLPGCITVGTDIRSAQLAAREALGLHIFASPGKFHFTANEVSNFTIRAADYYTSGVSRIFRSFPYPLIFQTTKTG